jgi:uncharacterized membrane protein
MFNTDHLHPMVVHFPIALILVGFLAEVASLFFKKEKCFSRTGFYLLILGALSAIVAWSTGQLFTDEPTQGAAEKIFNQHETWALITFILVIVGAVFRTFLVIGKKEETQLKWVAFALYFLAFVAVSYTGFLGGTMVYDYMMPL